MMKGARKEPDMILIVGASGRLGSVVVRHLLAQGQSIRVMTRNPLSLAHLKQQGVEIVSGDLRDRASLASACQGIEQVLAAAHALDGKGDNNPRAVDDMGNRHLIDAADRKSTRLNSSHANISYAVFCLKKKKKQSCRR